MIADQRWARQLTPPKIYPLFASFEPIFFNDRAKMLCGISQVECRRLRAIASAVLGLIAHEQR